MKNNSMTNLLSSDFFKLRKLKSVWIGLVIMVVLTFLVYAIFWIGLNVAEHIEVTEGVSTQAPSGEAIVDAPNVGEVSEQTPSEEEGISQADKDGIILSMRMLGNQLLTGFTGICGSELLIAIICCIFIGGEFANGSFRILISRGMNRVQLYFSKWITMATLVLAYSVFSLIVSGIFAAVKGYYPSFGGHEFGILMRAFGLQFLCNLATMTIVMMLCFLCRSSGSSLGATIGVYILFPIIFGSIETVMGVMMGKNVDWISFLPMQQSSIAQLATPLSTTEICAVVIMPIVYIALSMFVGLYTFIKRDVK